MLLNNKRQMQITTLPQDLKLNASSGVQVYPYRSNQDLQKAKIILSLNTISFLKKGTKEIFGHDTTARLDARHFVVMKAGNCLMTEKTFQYRPGLPKSPPLLFQ